MNEAMSWRGDGWRAMGSSIFFFLSFFVFINLYMYRFIHHHHKWRTTPPRWCRIMTEGKDDKQWPKWCVVWVQVCFLFRFLFLLIYKYTSYSNHGCPSSSSSIYLCIPILINVTIIIWLLFLQAFSSQIHRKTWLSLSMARLSDFWLNGA